MGYLAILPFFFLLILVSVLGFTKDSKCSDKNLQRVEQGSMSKVTYHGHTYVVWSINMGGGLVHDPDCECKKEK